MIIIIYYLYIAQNTCGYDLKRYLSSALFICDLRLHGQNISSGKHDILWFAGDPRCVSVYYSYLREYVLVTKRVFFKTISAD